MASAATPVKERVAVIGQGYVGLPVTLAFARAFPGTVGFDVDSAKVRRLAEGIDVTGETDAAELTATPVRFTSDEGDLRGATFFVVAVPTPITADRRPDLSYLRAASETVGRALSPGAVVVYESTVYPGVTEEVCGPVLERVSGLRRGVDFTLGYSPERINPGDKEHTLDKVVKVVAGEDEATLERVAAAYERIVPAGVFRASSIKVAEAAKVIENTQRDLNIALMNELAMIFDRLGIDTVDVLEAAGTKWNFLPFRPGLVGGHCIGVDPYYLTHKAQQIGYHPEVILAGRRINDSMGAHVAQRVVKLMQQRGLRTTGARVLVLGLAFKENCPDLRNTRVTDIIDELRSYSVEVEVHDPWVSPAQARHEYGISPVAEPAPGSYDAVILAVAHREFVAMGAEGVRALCRPGAVVFDVKRVLPRGCADDCL